MLQSIRENSQGIVAKIIVGLIIVTFALFGVESLISLANSQKAPASVNGEDISEQQLLQGVELQRRQILSRMGENADPSLLDDNLLRNMVLDGLVEQEVLLQAAQEQGLTVSDRMIDQMIVNTPQFQVDGQFNRDQFESVLRNAGMTPLMFRDYLRRDKLIEQNRAAYVLSSFQTQSEVERLLTLDGQTRAISYLTLSADQLPETAQVSDTELKAAYEAQSERFRTQEQVSLEYLLLDKDQLADDYQPSDEDLQAAYQQRLAAFNPQERRSAAHILIEVSDDVSDAQAKAKAQELVTELEQGADFAELARENSDDIATSAQGGDLGMAERGVFPQEFEDALYALPQEGAVSAPVRTEFGYHVIQLKGITAQQAPEFAELRAELARDLIAEHSEARYVELLEQLADETFSSATLAGPADVMGLEIQSTDAFSRAGGDDEITSNRKVLDQAFGAEVLEEGLNSQVVELSRFKAVVFRLKEHLEPRDLALEEVADTLRAELLAEKRQQLLQARADELLAQLKQGKSLNELAGDSAVNALTISRAEQSVEPGVARRAFELAHPEQDKPSAGVAQLADGSIAVLVVHQVMDGDADIDPQQLQLTQSMLAARQGEAAYQAHIASRKAAAEIERD